ncbi:MAG: type II secretion system F family protein [Thermoguttaceae bacterium]
MSGRLTPEESAELAFQVGELARAGQPLPAALRAAADEAPTRRLAGVLRRVADQLAAGTSLDEALAAEGPRLPAHFRGLLLAGVRSGRLAPILDGFVSRGNWVQEVRRRMAMKLAYPAGVVAIWCLLLAVIHTVLIGEFAPLYTDYGVRLPTLTALILHVPKAAVWLVAAVVAILPAMLVAACYLPLPARWSRVVWRLPLVGPAVRWSGLAQFCQLSALLLEAGVPLPEALRLAAGGVSHAGLATGGRRAALAVERGSPLDEALAAQECFPPTLIALVRWGRQNSSVAEAFRAADEMFEVRARDQGVLLEALVPPLAVLVVVGLIGTTVLAMFILLLNLIICLSGPFWYPPVSPPESPDLDPAGALAVTVLGIAVLVAVRLMGGPATQPKGALRFLLETMGWGLLVLGVTASIFTGPVNVIGLMTLGIVVLLIRERGAAVAQQAMLRLLTVSAERSIPLAPAVEALAREQGGHARRRARQFAQLIARGVPLPEAVAGVPGLLPAAGAPMMAVGYQTGRFAAALRRAAALAGRQEPLWQSFVPKAAYLCFMPLFTIGAIVFLGLKILPQLQKIFKDFGQALPAVTQAVSKTLFCCGGWPLMLLAVALVGLLLYVMLRYTGVIAWELPGTGRLARRLDTALVLDALALAAGAGQPILPALETLAGSYPKPAIRRRLSQVAADLAAGGDWCEALRRRGLLGKADQAVLSSAVRAGNLPWALPEVADANRRRFAYRTTALLEVLFPAFVLACGGIVLLLAAGVFLPLAQLIQNLASP